MDTRIQRILMIVVLFLFAIYTAGKGAAAGNIPFALILPLSGVAFYLLGKPTILFIWIFFAEIAKISIPGFPGALGASEILQLVLIGWAVIDAALNKEGRAMSYTAKSDFWMIIFLLNVMFTMYFRGFGLRIQGEGKYGGSGYIMLIISILFYFSAVKLRFTHRHGRMLIVAGLIAALIPAVVDIVVYTTKGESRFLLNYFRTAAGGLLKEQEAGSGMERWASFSNIATYLIPVAFLLMKNRIFRFVLLAAALVLVSLSGFRSRIVMFTLLSVGSWMYFERAKLRTAISVVMVLACVWIFLIIGATALPKAVQRSVSMLPLVRVDPVVLERAEGSVDWRVQMWKDYCIPNVPKYLWVGRGIAQNIMDYAWLQKSWYHGAEFFYFMGGYHSGPFSLLLDWGLVGTISFTAFFWVVMVDGWRTVRRHARLQESLSARYFAFLTIQMTFEFFSYYLIFGSVRSGLFRMLAIAAMMRIFKKSILEAARDMSKITIEDKQSETVSNQAALRPLLPSRASVHAQ